MKSKNINYKKTKIKSKNKEINYKEHRFNYQKNKNIKRIFFWFLVLFLIISFFARNNFKSVKFPNAKLFNEPVKTELLNSSPIEFSQDGFKFTLTPLYEYEMSALVVNRLDYTWFSLTRAGSAFPMDLCVTWGGNVESGAYRHSSVGFRQDSRFCFGNWSQSSGFTWTEVSNNHLVIKDEAIRKKAMSIVEGDQIKLKGKLVNVQTENIDGNLGKYENQISNWNSSVKLGDSGAGACEVVFVEDLEIIKKGNPFFFYGFKFALYLLLFITSWKIAKFFYELWRNK